MNGISSLVRKPLFIFGCSSLYYLLLCSFFWKKMPVSESVFFWKQSQTFHEAVTVYWHPPLYTILLSLFRAAFQDHFIGGYALGICSVLLSGWIFVQILAHRNKDASCLYPAYWLILPGYFSLPIITQGTFIFDIDNTILTPVLLFVFLSYLRYHDQTDVKNGIILFLAITLSLWSKMTTPVLLLFSISFFHFIQLDFRFLLKRLAPIVVCAVALFYICYSWLYTKYVLGGTGSYQLAAGKLASLLGKDSVFRLPWKQFLFSVGSNLGALVAWSSPLLLLTVLILFWIVGGKIRHSLGILYQIKMHKIAIVPTIFIIVTIITYTFILKLQASAGYPKYHYPIFGFLFLIIGYTLTDIDAKLRKMDLSILLISFLLFFFLIRDPLVQLYDFGRKRQMFDLLLFFLTYTTVTLLPLAVYYPFRRKELSRHQSNAIAIVLALLLVANLSSFVFRSQADYLTNYHYGLTGTQKALDYANDIPLDKSVYFPFVGYFLQPHPKYNNSVFGRLLGSDSEKPTTDYIILSDSMLSSSAFLFGVDYMEGKYNRIDTIRSYGIWKKKEKSN